MAKKRYVSLMPRDVARILAMSCEALPGVWCIDCGKKIRESAKHEYGKHEPPTTECLDGRRARKRIQELADPLKRW